jgi:hypothetical protein
VRDKYRRNYSEDGGARTAKGWFIVFNEHPTGRWVLQLKVCIHRDCEKSKEKDESVHITSSWQVLELSYLNSGNYFAL